MKKYLLLAGTLLLLIAINACEKYVIKPPDDVGEVTFSGSIQPIFTAQCTGCHNGATHPLNLTEGTAFSALQSYTPTQGGETINSTAPEESVLYIMALNGAHGFFSLSAIQEARILKWIEDGAPNN